MDGAGERMEIEMSSDSQTTLPDFVCSAGTGCYAPKIYIKNIRYYVLEDIARLYRPGIVHGIYYMPSLFAYSISWYIMYIVLCSRSGQYFLELIFLESCKFQCNTYVSETALILQIEILKVSYLGGGFNDFLYANFNWGKWSNFICTLC